jgi:hypothetical protein
VIRKETLVVTADAAGAGTAVSVAPIVGEILSVRLAGTALGGTADFTLTRDGDGGTVLVVTNGAGPWQYQPREAAHSTAGGTTSYSLGSGALTEGVPSADYLRLVVVQAAANAGGTVHIHYRT